MSNRCAWLALAFVIIGGRAWSAEPLAALVPDDVGLCFEVSHLADHVAEFRHSDLYKRVKAFSPLHSLAAHRIGELKKLTTKLEKELNVDTETLWAKIIGQEVLVAVWPPAKAGGEGPALFLVRSPDPKMLRQVFDHIVAQQSREGDAAPLKPSDDAMLVTSVRSKSGRPPVFLGITGSLGVISTSEGLIHPVLAAANEREALKASLAELPAYKAGQARLEPEAVVRLFLNPRPWYALLESSPQPRDDRENVVRDTLLATWKASEYFVASLSADRELRGEAYLQCNRAALPETLRNLVESVGGESKLAERIPRDTLLSIAGRIDTRRLVQSLIELNRSGKYFGAPGRLPPAWGPALALLSGLGPDVGVSLIAPESSASAAAGWPIRWLAAIGSRPLEANGKQPALVEELVPLVRASLDFAAQLESARKPERLVQVQTEPASERCGPLTTVYGLPRLKADEAVSFTVANRTLWISSDTTLVRDAAEAANCVAPPTTRLLKPGVLLYCNLAAIRSTLAMSPPTASALGKFLNVEPAEGRRKLTDLLTVLKLADALVITGGADGHGFSCAWRLTASEAKE